MQIDAATIEWLKAGAKWEVSTGAGVAAAWGSDAAITEIVSALALASDASVEAARQQGFFEGPIAIERHVVPGLKAYLRGRLVTLTADRLGYDAGLDVFVISVEEQDGGLTALIVLRRLP